MAISAFFRIFTNTKEKETDYSVSFLSRCSDQLAALALAEDKHFAECSQMDSFMKLTVLRNANRSIIDLLADIRNHYDGLH